MTQNPIKLSVVIPVGPSDAAWQPLYEKIKAISPHLAASVEWIWAIAENGQENLFNVSPGSDEMILRGPTGRAQQMNNGAAVARARWLWFLHCDSLIDDRHVECALKAVEQNQNEICFFDLKFMNSSSLVKWNEIAANWRSRQFGLPFGDQGLLMNRETFYQLGAYDSREPFAEDLRLVLQAKKRNIPWRSLGLALLTSARKYDERGWLRTTLKNQYWTWRITAEELLKSSEPMRAMACFVKTLGYSKVKTRLAKTIGEEKAHEFYQLSVLCTEKQMLKLKPKFISHWAIAEVNAKQESIWKSFASVEQGEGGLGERLHQVYQTLRKDYLEVFLIGADSPHIQWNDLRLDQALRSHDFVVGLCDDGGFYLFGGRKEVPKELWLNINYSSSSTGKELVKSLSQIGSVKLLPQQFDIDEWGDLLQLKSALGRTTDSAMSPLLMWLENLNSFEKNI